MAGIQQETCDVLGLTTIMAMDDPFNEFLYKYIFEDNHPSKMWKKLHGNQSLTKTFKEITQTPDGPEEEDIEDIHTSWARPYGLTCFCYTKNGKRVLRQTKRTLYGQDSASSGMLIKHPDCREDHACVYLSPSEYAYIKYRNDQY